MWDWLIAAALLFPDVEARDLAGRAARVADLRGAPAVLALGFSYDSRRQVEPWSRQLVEGTGGKLRVIVMPVYKGLPGPLRGMVDGAMARAMPAVARPHVWTTTDYDGLAKGLGLGTPTDAAIVLVDGAGVVRHVARGAPTPAAVRALIEAWRGLPATGS